MEEHKMVKLLEAAFDMALAALIVMGVLIGLLFAAMFVLTVMGATVA